MGDAATGAPKGSAVGREPPPNGGVGTPSGMPGAEAAAPNPGGGVDPRGGGVEPRAGGATELRAGAVELGIHLNRLLVISDAFFVAAVESKEVADGFVGAGVVRKSRQARCLHGNLGARYHEVVEIDWKLSQHPQRIEIGNQRNDDKPDCDARRNRNAQNADHSAVATRGTKCAVGIASAHCPIGVRRF